MAKKVAATTVGCKVNQYDTKALLQKFLDAGYEVVNFADEADIYIINTCSVTNVSDKKSRQMVRRAKARGAVVAVMGCSSQARPEDFAKIGADIVLGTANRGKILEYVENFPVIDHNPNVTTMINFEADHVDSRMGKTRAFLKIQDGCDNFCTYCVVPHVRGPSRSRPFDDVMAQACRFAEMGCKEIVVAGIHVASYGKDLKGHNLLSVLQGICEIDCIKRVRLSSVEPNVITEEFLEFAAAQPKFCDHLHLSLQSGSDAVLAAMNRKYTARQYADAVSALRKVLPNISITTDIIAGFSGESEENHRETLDFIDDLALSALHVFPFAAKEGTVAAMLPNQHSRQVKSRRAKELENLGVKLKALYYDRFVGQTLPVLVEGRNVAGFYEGKTTNYLSVCFEGKEGHENSIVDVRLNTLFDDGAIGVLQ